MTMMKFLIWILLLTIVVSIPIAAAAETGGDNDINQTSASQPYYITIDPIGNHTVNEVIFINGTTNLPISENLSISVNDNSFNPAGLYGSFFDTTIPIQLGENGVNYWSCNITPTLSLWKTYGGRGPPTNDIKYFILGDFVATVESNNVIVNSELFTISSVESGGTSTPTRTQTPSPTPTTSLPLTQTAEITLPPSTTPASPLSLIVPMIAITGVVVLHLTGRKRWR